MTFVLGRRSREMLKNVHPTLVAVVGKAILSQLRAVAPELTVSLYLSKGSAESPMRQRAANAVPAKGTTRAAISAALRRLRLGASILPTDMW